MSGNESTSNMEKFCVKNGFVRDIRSIVINISVDLKEIFLRLVFN